MVQAYKATVVMHSKGFMLGGGSSHTSYPFEKQWMAQEWGETVIKTNRERPGYEHAEFTLVVSPVEAKNPIRETELA
jgi:hypothetical protein